MKKVYAQWKSMNIADAVRDDRRSLTASSSKMTYNDTINNIYSDGKSLYVTNHALKCNSGDKVLCEVSPTSGYVWMSVAGKDRCNDFVPSDCGFADHFVNVHIAPETKLVFTMIVLGCPTNLSTRMLCETIDFHGYLE